MCPHQGGHLLSTCCPPRARPGARSRAGVPAAAKGLLMLQGLQSGVWGGAGGCEALGRVYSDDPSGAEDLPWQGWRLGGLPRPDPRSGAFLYYIPCSATEPTLFLITNLPSLLEPYNCIATGHNIFHFKQLSFNPICICLPEKAMAPHSSTLAWKIHRRRSLVGCSPWGR